MLRKSSTVGTVQAVGILSAFILASCQVKPKSVEGVYSLCDEVRDYSGEVLELKNGTFRYWFYSDFETGDEPTYPLTGTYQLKGDVLCLDDNRILLKERTIASVNGADVLWREDGLRLWTQERTIQGYAVLIRIPETTDGSKIARRPSIKSLYTKEMLDLERREYEGRFSDQPAEVRALLRARTTEGDSQKTTYLTAMGHAQTRLDPVLVGQLVSLIGPEGEAAMYSEFILQDLYGVGHLIQQPPVFLKDAGERKLALEALADGLSQAKNRNAVEETLLVFLRASGVGKIDLACPGTGIRIRIEAPTKGDHQPSEVLQVIDPDWHRALPKLIPKCQEWMRTQISK